MKLFQNFSFKKLLYNKKISIAISIVIAFVFWLIIVIDQNPEREQTIRNVPITITTEGTNLKDVLGLEVVSEINQQATVKVFGPNYIVSSLKSDDVKIVADYSKVNDSGEFQIQLTAVRNSSDSGYEFISVEPSSINVKFDYWDTKEFTILPDISGYQKLENIIYEDTVVTTDGGNTISISGPREEMNKIDKIVAHCSTDKAVTKNEQFSAELQFLDKNGNELNKSKYSFDELDVKILVQLYKTKTFSFVPTYKNLPNDAVKTLLNNCLKLNTVGEFEVKGPAELIDQLAYIEFEEIDVLKISMDGENTFTLKPKSPDSKISIINGFESVTVSFDLSKLSKHYKLERVSRFSHEGTLADGLTVVFPSFAYVRLMGDQLAITAITGKLDSLYFSADLTGYEAGTHNIDVYVKNDLNLAVMQAKPITITVTIK